MTEEKYVVGSEQSVVLRVQDEDGSMRELSLLRPKPLPDSIEFVYGEGVLKVRPCREKDAEHCLHVRIGTGGLLQIGVADGGGQREWVDLQPLSELLFSTRTYPAQGEEQTLDTAERVYDGIVEEAFGAGVAEEDLLAAGWTPEALKRAGYGVGVESHETQGEPDGNVIHIPEHSEDPAPEIGPEPPEDPGTPPPPPA